jgi:hypothetical protein
MIQYKINKVIPNVRQAWKEGVGPVAFITKMPRPKHPYEVEFFGKLPRRAFDRLREAKAFIESEVQV